MSQLDDMGLAFEFSKEVESSDKLFRLEYETGVHSGRVLRHVTFFGNRENACKALDAAKERGHRIISFSEYHLLAKLLEGAAELSSVFKEVQPRQPLCFHRKMKFGILVCPDCGKTARDIAMEDLSK